MPFSRIPPGFDSDSLRLLDVALTRTWLERVLVGASLSGADSTICADLRAKIERLDRLQTGQLSKRAQRSEKVVAVHKFKIGERVIYHSPRNGAPPAVFTVLRLMPVEGRDITYRVKSTEIGTERVARESDLSSLEEVPT